MGFDPLADRAVAQLLDELAHALPRVLADNPDGTAIVGDALRRAMRVGLEAGCADAGTSVDELDFENEPWRRWQVERQGSLEGEHWPGVLGLTAPDAVERAKQLLADAAAELDFHGGPARRLRAAGEQAAEAGAAMARALSEPVSAEASRPTATPARPGGTLPDGRVGVAVAANQAEAELVQGMLADAGIPSTWRRVGADWPDLLAAGYREVYVPAGAAEEARAVLATVELPDQGDDAEPTQRVGLERTGLRLAGKATALVVVFGFLVALPLFLFAGHPILAGATLLAVVLGGVTLIAWSERAG